MKQMKSESLKRGFKITIGLILILFLLPMVSGKSLSESISGILSITSILFATLFLSLHLEDRIKFGIERGRYFWLYLLLLSVLGVLIAVNLLMGVKLENLIKLATFSLLIILATAVTPILLRWVRFEKKADLSFKDVVKLTGVALLLALLVGGVVVLLKLSSYVL
ncbi:hypothetical protein [Geoglobus acetivorans]|uniref:Uncharacterized protein n=1 Tax=Geoglobus acetivorans TaxID=565033 RepID=A0ABZ3H3Y6_GEOAI|nr:hypothetical protein [Geoglobus acetivorans]